MANEMIGFGGLKFFLVILSEKIIKCVLKFCRFARISKDDWKG
jgi:hypothetical protein